MDQELTKSARIDFSEEKYARRRRRRALKDKLAAGAIGFGGISVIIAILLIFIYLLVEVAPLFGDASVNEISTYRSPEWNNPEDTLLLAMEEQAEVGLRLTRNGDAIFFSTEDGRIVSRDRIAFPAGTDLTGFSNGAPGSGLLVFGFSDGSAVVARHQYKSTYPNDLRVISASISYPYGPQSLQISSAGDALEKLAIRDDEEALAIVAAGETGQLSGVVFEKIENFLTDEVSLERRELVLPSVSGAVSSLHLDVSKKWLYAQVGPRQLQLLLLHGGEEFRAHTTLDLLKTTEVRKIHFLLGGISILVGDSQGEVSQWFLVRDEDESFHLERIRDFDSLPGAITHIEPEQRRKGFVAVSDQGWLGIYNTTARRTVLEKHLDSAEITNLALSPRGSALIMEDSTGSLLFSEIDNEHPEISWSSMWQKVWYESYPEPDYIWQSSASTNEFEPKLSLMPLTFGTLKAAFYAMLLAAPLAICGAIFTAHFMAPPMRRKVKPLIELMEALPTVILGFLAGLWLAPLVESNLPGVLSLLVIMPMVILLTSLLWTMAPQNIRLLIPEGWEAAILIPVIVVAGWSTMEMSEPLELLLFDGNMRSWLANTAGINFDQRNSIVVGLAMGFAVIPTIFSIAEDAIFSVPKHLVNGSLALGATQWQTLMRVVILTASPGIFSALMIGFGRAVGETMIVLMATGNTPIMDWNIFEGMRTLAANIAVEMPESEVGSTHFRVLFLAALVLFMFTFVVNTVAEIVRQRLRERYGSL